MAEIKNILFDFGGVFIGVDYKKTEDALVRAGITNFHDLYSQHSASPLFEQLEKGEIEEPHFYATVRKLSGLSLTDEQIRQCWNEMLGDFYPEAIQNAKELAGNYRLFLFSNTNSIHYSCVMEKFQKQFGSNNFNDLFEKAYYSHTAGLRKPGREAFEWVLNDAGINASETLFIDDTISNINGAKEAGLQTVFLEPGMKMWELDL